MHFDDGKQLVSFCVSRVQFISSLIVQRHEYIAQFNQINVSNLKDWHIFYILLTINNKSCMLIAHPFVHSRPSVPSDFVDWVEVFFESKNKFIDFCKNKLGYTNKLLKPVIDYQDMQFIKTYAYNKKERLSGVRFASFHRAVTLIHKKTIMYPKNWTAC